MSRTKTGYDCFRLGKTIFVLSGLWLLVATARGQSPIDGFDPNANGDIRAIVVQRDGKIVIGGEFTTLTPNGGPSIVRHYIARLNVDGTIDTAFNPNASGPVYALALQGNDKILVGGSFGGPLGIGGQPRNGLARLYLASGLADTFDPNSNGTVVSIAVQQDGKVLAGGLFDHIGDQPRKNIARLDPVTGLADAFNPNANGLVTAMAIQADGKILVGGWFAGPNSIGGQTRNRIARLDGVTGLADSFDPNANGQVMAIAIQVDGRILAGGVFNGINSIGGQTRNHIARLDPITGLADSFDPDINGTVFAIASQVDGKIVVAGSFTSVGSASRNRIARLELNSGFPDSLDPNANNVVYAAAIQPDGKIVVGGSFGGANSIAGQTRNRIARLERDGRLDQTLNLNVVNNTWLGWTPSMATQGNGKIIIGGDFTTVLGVTRNHIARVNTDGTLDTSFDPNADGTIDAIIAQADGKILVCGWFDHIGGQVRRFIARLDGATGLADSFDPNPNNFVQSIAVQPDGKILAGGFFTTIGGASRNYIARIDSATGLADTFNPNATGAIYAIALQTDGKVLVAGDFTTISGLSRNHLARLDGITGLADSFDPNANALPLAIALQPDGKIQVGGDFTTIGGQTRNHIARLDATTGLADSFDPNADSRIESISVQEDSRILVGGSFTIIGGQTHYSMARLSSTTGLADSYTPVGTGGSAPLLLLTDGKVLAGGAFSTVIGGTNYIPARLTNDTAALQSLAVTPTSITWTRGGSSPQLSTATFEYSTDNANYTTLGNGMGSGSGWTISGLTLPEDQIFYIRARGYYHSGIANSSQSITELVRAVHLPEPITPPTPTPAPTPSATVTISGSLSLCSNPVPGPVAHVIMWLTGDWADSTISDDSGNYALSIPASGGTYTITPRRSGWFPGASNIVTADAIAVLRHFMKVAPLPLGCSQRAADVNNDSKIDTVDVIAIERFILRMPTGTGNAGKYEFMPASRTYSGNSTNQPNQNFDALVFGDVAAPFVGP